MPEETTKPKPTIGHAADELAKLVLWIDSHYSTLSLPADPRGRMACGCLDLGLEHQAAIALLIQQEMYGSAMALFRVLFETCVRGMWLARCATDHELRVFQRDNIEKDFATLVQEVEAALGNPRNAIFSKMKKDSWSFMNSLTHTGFQHIVRRNSETATGPNYPENEVTHLANAAGALGLIMALELAALGKHLPLGELTLKRCREFADS